MTNLLDLLKLIPNLNSAITTIIVITVPSDEDLISVSNIKLVINYADNKDFYIIAKDYENLCRELESKIEELFTDGKDSGKQN